MKIFIEFTYSISKIDFISTIDIYFVILIEFLFTKFKHQV